MTEHPVHRVAPAPISRLRLLVQVEAAAIAVAALWGYSVIGAGWALFALLVLTPDLAMLGYLAGPRIGAVCYNIAHSVLGPLILAALGAALSQAWAVPVALIWTFHIAVDRALGYGLKYGHAFKATHLQRI